MNVLLVTPQPPYPPTQGAALRNFAMVRHLAKRHAVHLLSFAETSDNRTAEDELRLYCQSVSFVPAPRRRMANRLRTLLTTRLPDMAERLAMPTFRRRLDEILSQTAFDVVQFEGIELAPYMLLLPKDSAPALIFDEHNAEYLLQRRTFAIDRKAPRRLLGAIYSLIQWRRLTIYERAACRHANAIVAVSAEDRRALLALDPALDVRVIPNGVDVDAFSALQIRDSSARQEPTRLVFVGTMCYRPNVDAVVWFCAEVLPRIVQVMPAVQFVIVGRDPTPAVLRLRAPHVVVTGTVPDDRPYLAGAALYVVPIRTGGGMRFKILQAMAAGLPVVTTRLGAEGIDVHHGIHCRIADDAETFAKAVIEILQKPAMGRSMAAVARQYVAERFDWRVTLAPLDDLYQQIETVALANDSMPESVG